MGCVRSQKPSQCVPAWLLHCYEEVWVAVENCSRLRRQQALVQSAAVRPEAYTLVQAMLGGFNWGEVSDVLMDIDVNHGFQDRALQGKGCVGGICLVRLRAVTAEPRISPALLLLYVAFTMLAATGLAIFLMCLIMHERLAMLLLCCRAQKRERVP